MSDVILRENLLSSFLVLQESFKESLDDAKKLDKQFQKIQKDFSVRMASCIRQAKKSLPDENPLSNQMDSILSAITATDKAWQDNLTSYDKGLNFRQNFQDSLLVFVFGKVKSGKSSLGNYMAWGNTDPSTILKTPESTFYQPEYFTEVNTNVTNGDTHDEAKLNREFRVGATEATSSIQGFRLPGLTWVDSPGLHSVNDINGQLAQEYVDHADLILYTMSSDAPGRASDIEEIKELTNKGKEILILITGSDFNDEFWDDELNDLVVKVKMKTDGNQQKQREYIKNELKVVNSRDILSVSARYAQEHSDELNEMESSGITQLFSRLRSISQNQGLQIKRAVPMTNFNKFLSKCQKELHPYKKLTEDLNAEISKLERSVPMIMSRHAREAQQEMSALISSTFDLLANHRDDDEKMNQELREARRGWNDKLQQIIGTALESGLVDISNNLKQAADKTWYTASLELPGFSIEKVTEKISIGHVPGTKNRNSGWGGLSGTVVGGVVGFFIGGPPGAVLGSSLGGGVGGLAGSAIGDDAKLKTKDIEINVGDNLESLKKQVRDEYLRVIETVIKDESEKMLKDVLADMKNVTRQITNELSRVNEGVKNLKALSLQNNRRGI